MGLILTFAKLVRMGVVSSIYRFFCFAETRRVLDTTTRLFGCCLASKGKRKSKCKNEDKNLADRRNHHTVTGNQMPYGIT